MLARVVFPMFCVSASGTELRYVILRTAGACGGAHPVEERVATRFVRSCCRGPTYLGVLLHGEGDDNSRRLTNERFDSGRACQLSARVDGRVGWLRIVANVEECVFQTALFMYR